MAALYVSISLRPTIERGLLISGLIVGLLFVGTLSAPAAAQAPDSLSTDTAGAAWRTALPPLTVTATRVPAVPSQAPARIRVLDSTALAQTGATSVSELLEERAGLYVRQYGPGGLATVSLRGTGASQTAFLLDGHRIGNPQLGQLDLRLLPTILLSSVEVMHGPASPLHGSDGIGGAVHLRSLQPTSPLRAKASVHGGAFGTRGTSILLGGEDGSTSGVVAAEYRYTDGDFPYTDEALFPPRTVRRRNADRERLSVYSSVRTRWADHALRVAGWWTKSERGLPGSSSTASNNERQWDTQLRLWADDTIQQPWGTLTLGGLVQHSRLRYADPDQDLDQTGRTWRSSLEAEARVPLTDRWRVTGGLSAERATAQHPSLADRAREQQGAAFLSGRGTLGRLRLFPAVRLDVYRMPGADAYASVNPRLGINWQPLPNVAPFRLKAHAGRAFRTPTLNDRYWDPGGRPNLRPERGWSVDAGMLWNGSRGRLEASVFTNWRRNQIVWRPSGNGYWRPANVQRVRARGWELSAERQWRLSEATELQTGLTYTYTDARNRSAPGTNTYNAPLRYVPRDQMKPHLTLSWGPAALDLNARYTGRRYVTSDGSRSLDPYVLLDAQLRLSHRLGSVQGTVSAQLENALDTNYTVVNNHPMPPRHLTVRVAAAF
jgi:iron complex outermembrane receptor protein